MIGARGFLVMFVLASAITITIMGFADKLDPRRGMCASAQAHLIDRCAKSGGLNR